MNVPRILAVIVVYERELDEVRGWRGICKELADAGNDSGLGSGCHLSQILIYDNSRQERAKPLDGLPNCIYVHDAGNGGTAAAYACAAVMANELGLDWLLLLDQDTLLPDNYFEAAGDALTRTTQLPVAMLPWVFHGSAVVSPASVTTFGKIKPLDYQDNLIFTPNLTGISSGCMLSVSAFFSCMPFPENLWLDYVDHWIFANLRLRNNAIIGFDAKLQHNLSVFDVKTLSVTRLTSILDGEFSFLAMQGIAARIAYPFRLAVRVLRYFFMQPRLAVHILSWTFRRICFRK